MATITDKMIAEWIASGERFESRSAGGGLVLRYRAADRIPSWRFRYRMGDGKQRVMSLGPVDRLNAAAARAMAATLNAQVILGHDPAGEREDRQKAAERARDAMSVPEVCDAYYAAVVVRDWKNPAPIRYRLDNIRKAIGDMPAASVTPSDIATMIDAIVARGAPTVANETLLWSKRVFSWAKRREIVASNPAEGFGKKDAGGVRQARERWLNESDLRAVFKALESDAGAAMGESNKLALMLLLMLMVRKEELTRALRSEFDLDGAVWNLPPGRTKTGVGMVIPLPPLAVACLRRLFDLAGCSPALLPARLWRTKDEDDGRVSIGSTTINLAVNRHLMPVLVGEGVAPFVIHDLRRTGRTWLTELGVDYFVAERCLNHKLPGVAGAYDRSDRLEARRAALELWAGKLVSFGAVAPA